MNMMSRATCFSAIALGLALIAGAQPAQAACGAPFLITSIDQGGGAYSYVITPGVDVGDGFRGSSITEDFGGAFWALGFGNPAPGVGADNGAWPALNWLYTYPGYPASILTTWAADPSIDTCIDVQGPLGQRCQATLLSDVNPQTGEGVWALSVNPDNPSSGDFFLIARPQPRNLVLAPSPQLGLDGDPERSGSGLDFTLTVPGSRHSTRISTWTTPAGARPSATRAHWVRSR